MKIVYPTWLELQFNDNDGNPLSLGRIYTYKSGVGSLANTYNENDQVNSNPVILDANGRATIRLDSSFAYKFEVRDKNNVLIYERDKVYGSEVGQTEGTNDHDQLINRDLTNQHPTSAVTGLDTALSAITGDVLQLIIDVTNLDENKVNRSGDTMTGALGVETGLFGFYDSSNKFNPNGFFGLYALENEASFFYQSNRVDPHKIIKGISNASKSELTVSHGFGREIESYVGEDHTELQILRDGNGFTAIADEDGLGDPRARLKIMSFNRFLEVQSLSDSVKLSHYDGVATDTLLLPTVTGETKTLATLDDIPTTASGVSFVPTGGISATNVQTALVELDTEKANKSTTLAGYGITDALDTSAVTQTKIGSLVLRKGGGGLPLALETTSSDSSLARSVLTTKHKTTATASNGFGNAIAFLVEDSTAIERVQGAIITKRSGVLSSATMTLQTSSAGSLQDVVLFGVDKSATFYGNLLPQEKIITSASTTTRAGVNLPHGVEPTVKVNGDKWTTTAGEFTRVNGVTYETAVKSFAGNLQLLSLGDTAIGQNTTTNERGHLVRMINGTGSTSVKGTLISASTTVDNQFVLQANEFDAFGVIAESGIASGQECWIWVNGSTCEVLWENGQSSTRGYLAICAPTDGMALNVAVPNSNPTVGEHFKECGHVLQSKTAGTNVLVLCQIHFN